MKIALSSKNAILALIIVMSVSPAFALGDDNRNLLLIGVMMVSPFIVLSSLGKFYFDDLPLLIFILTILIFPNFVQHETIRWSTILYSCMFAITFLAYKKLLKLGHLKIDDYLNLLKYLIYAYAFVLIIQQFCVLTGLPIFNVSNYSYNEPWKLNSLAAEPSHSARVVGVLMYSYLALKFHIASSNYNFVLDIKKYKSVWAAFLWSMLTMKSGTAIAMLMIVYLKSFSFKKLITMAIFTAGVVSVAIFFNNNEVDRTYRFSLAVLSFDVDAMVEADHSAALRVAPAIVMASKVNILSFEDWFGHGVDSSGKIISDQIAGIPEGSVGGAMFRIWYEYGFISFIFFILFSVIHTLKIDTFSNSIIWLFLIFLGGVNNQFTWLAIILLFTNNHFIRLLSLRR